MLPFSDMRANAEPNRRAHDTPLEVKNAKLLAAITSGGAKLRVRLRALLGDFSIQTWVI